MTVCLSPNGSTVFKLQGPATDVLVGTIDLRGASGCPGMRLGDINGDGRLEIVVGQPVDQATLDSYTPQMVAADRAKWSKIITDRKLALD